jgi:hypothetical protein
VIAMDVMKMAVVQVIRVAIMFDRRMTAARTVLVRMTFDFRAGIHNQSPFESLW